MRVRSPDGARLSVEQEAHCALFARALGVEIDEMGGEINCRAASTRMIFSRISSMYPSAITKGLSVFVSSVKCPIRFITHTSPKLVL